MKNLRRIAVLILTLLFAFALVPAAFAHPLGNFTINQYVGLHISRGTILLDYVVDMAEIPAFQELAPFDSDRDRQPDLPALQQYPAEKCASLLADLDLLLANRRVELTPTSSSLELPVGMGGLPTIRLTCEFRAPIDSTESNIDLFFTNNAFPDRLGWKEVIVFADGISLEGDFTTESPSNRLTNYPQDLLNSPLDQRQAEFEIVPVVSTVQNESVPSAVATVALPAERNDVFTRLILIEEITLPALLIALGISFVWGAVHAMTPGHGKTIVGAYLVGSRGTVKHALYLGLTTTVTHTLGVFALGFVTLFAAQYIVPETLFPWMSLLSGLFVVAIGLSLFSQRFRSSGVKDWLGRLKARLPGLQPVYLPTLHGATKSEGSNHKHRFVMTPTHDHLHSHGQAFKNHNHDHIGHHHDHEHGHGDHSHAPPEAITWRSLLALGMSGGLIPCPSALVVMLGAIALNRIGFGLVLVLAFSLGLAGALTVIGMLFIYAGRMFKKFPSSGKVIGFLPVMSALFISLIGLGIVYRALAEVGVL